MASTHTTNLGLNKPDRQDLVSVVNDINDNMDMIDTAIGDPSSASGVTGNDAFAKIGTLDSEKIDTSDIVNNLTTNDPTKPLSAAQGYALNSKIDNKFKIVSSGSLHDLAGQSGVFWLTSGVTDKPEAGAGIFILNSYNNAYCSGIYVVADNNDTYSVKFSNNTWSYVSIATKVKTRVVQGTTGSTGSLWTGVPSTNFIMGQKMNTNANLDVQGYVAYNGSWYLQSTANTSVDITVIYKEP